MDSLIQGCDSKGKVLCGGCVEIGSQQVVFVIIKLFRKLEITEFPLRDHRHGYPDHLSRGENGQAACAQAEDQGGQKGRRAALLKHRNFMVKQKTTARIAMVLHCIFQAAGKFLSVLTTAYPEKPGGYSPSE